MMNPEEFSKRRRGKSWVSLLFLALALPGPAPHSTHLTFDSAPECPAPRNREERRAAAKEARRGR